MSCSSLLCVLHAVRSQSQLGCSLPCPPSSFLSLRGVGGGQLCLNCGSPTPSISSTSPRGLVSEPGVIPHTCPQNPRLPVTAWTEPGRLGWALPSLGPPVCCGAVQACFSHLARLSQRSPVTPFPGFRLSIAFKSHHHHGFPVSSLWG